MKYLSVLAILLSLSLAQAQNTSPPLDQITAQCLKDKARYDDEVKRQLALPFEEKFKIVATDLDALSQKNIQRIKGDLFAHVSGFDQYYQQAKNVMAPIDSKLQVMHGTSLESAKGIIKSGSISSLDELVRKGIVPASNKTSLTKV